MDTDLLTNLILSKYPDKYTKESIQKNLIPNLQKMQPLLQKGLLEFLTKNTLLEINLLGFTIQSLKANHSMNEIAAYITLNWILEEPEKAISSLEKGHDRIDSI